MSDLKKFLPDAFARTPVGLKVVSKDIPHKSDAGGVRLGIVGRSTIQEEAASLLSEVGRRCPGADIAGVLANSISSFLLQ
jgi:acyl-CoA synthetase (NDP forming)